LALSASREIDADTRTMILRAAGLFRLDVVIAGDTLRTIVRNLSAGEITMRNDTAGYATPAVVTEALLAYAPTGSAIGFTIRSSADLVTVEVLLGTLRFAERGCYQVTAQAIIRRPEGPRRSN
jgi:hypothetical protein